MGIGKRLTALKVEKEKKPGLYSDGLGLYLQVRSGGAKSWIFRYRTNGPPDGLAFDARSSWSDPAGKTPFKRHGFSYAPAPHETRRPHRQGFRSTFRDWAAERTSFPREVAEMALAHTISDKVEAARRRRRQTSPRNVGRLPTTRRGKSRMFHGSWARSLH